MAHAVNIENKFTQFAETWSPKVIARLNDYEIKVVRLEGEFVTNTTPLMSCSS